MTAASSGAESRPTLDAKAIQRRSKRKIDKTRKKRLVQARMEFSEYSINRVGKRIRREKLEPFLAKVLLQIPESELDKEAVDLVVAEANM
jgi:hypothetical protein